MVQYWALLDLKQNVALDAQGRYRQRNMMGDI